MGIRQLFAPILMRRRETVAVAGTPKDTLRRRISPRARLVVRADKGTNYRFTRYGTDGNSPHQLASEVFLRTGDVGAVEKFLSDFIGARKPASLSELLFGRCSQDYSPLDRMSPLVKFQPWLPAPREAVGFVGQREASFGKVDLNHVHKEAVKQVAAVTSLRDNGYQPELRKNGYLKGRILLSGGDYRFLVEDGKHRLGALNALGGGEIAIRINPDGPAVVDEAEVDDWPMVASGQCSRALALQLLRRHFA